MKYTKVKTYKRFHFESRKEEKYKRKFLCWSSKKFPQFPISFYRSQFGAILSQQQNADVIKLEMEKKNPI